MVDKTQQDNFTRFNRFNPEEKFHDSGLILEEKIKKLSFTEYGLLTLTEMRNTLIQSKAYTLVNPTMSLAENAAKEAFLTGQLHLLDMLLDHAKLEHGTGK